MAGKSKREKFELTPEVAYLVGVIVGDGSISAQMRRYPPTDEVDPRIIIETGNPALIFDVLKPRFDRVLQRSCHAFEKVRPERNHRKSWIIDFRSKYFHKFLTEDLDLPKGKKAGIVSLKGILEKVGEDKVLRKELLAGIFDTDGGFRGRGIGQTTASIVLRDEMVELLAQEGFVSSKDQWFNKRYQKTYYGWRIANRKQIEKFLEKFPLKNAERVNSIRTRILSSARVPEGPNGQENVAPKPVPFC